MNYTAPQSRTPKTSHPPANLTKSGIFKKGLAWAVNTILFLLTGLLCRMDAAELARIPQRGPLILIGNHINFLEVPTLFTRIWPRPVAGFSKVETWYNPFKAFLFNIWGGVPLHRGEADLEAFRTAEKILQAGKIFVISPEGTRSGDGRLQKGHPGATLLAVRSGAPVMPLAFYGSENFWNNIKKLKRTDFHVRVGNPFWVETHGQGLSREVREQATREMMHQLAALLPSENRGVYADMENATEKYLRFEPGVESNLRRVLPPPAQESL
ncbi:MAG: 1-acyl-sn-glycerol-3-phosphate acyltransferase [Anaerolineaceae bacterium]|nr:1-acyl-sn-glycerol-3-phosphate acyltransferase [Anaerolineaceae bacterium]